MTDKEKNEKFQRILPKRIENFIVSADRLGKLSNKHYFNFTPEEAQKVKKKIEEVCKRLADQFN